MTHPGLLILVAVLVMAAAVVADEMAVRLVGQARRRWQDRGRRLWTGVVVLAGVGLLVLALGGCAAVTSAAYPVADGHWRCDPPVGVPSLCQVIHDDGTPGPWGVWIW